MGIIIRQSIKSSIVSYAGIVLGAVNMLFIFPSFLSQQEIGLIRLLESIALMMAIFGGLGSNQIADRFFPRFRAPEYKHHGYFTFLLLINFAGFLLASILFIFFQDFWFGFYREEAPEVVEYLVEIIFFAFCIMSFHILESYSRIHLRIVVSNLLRQVGIRLVITLSIILYAFQWVDFYGLVIWRILSYGSMAVLLGIYIKILGVFFISFNAKIFSQPIFKEIYTYGAYIIVGGASSVIITQIDSLMIGSMLKTEQLGIYTIAFFVGAVVEVPRKMLSQIISPIVSQAWTNQDLEQINLIYKKSSINQFIAGALIFIGIWASIDDVFYIMPNGAGYLPGKHVVFFVGITRVTFMVSGVSHEILLQSKYYKVNLLTAFVLAIFITISNLIFIPWLGITGAALATFISYLLYTIVRVGFLWYQYNIQPFSYRTLVVAGITLIVYFSAQLLPELPYIFLNLALKSGLIFILFVILVYVTKVSEDYNQLALLVIQKIKSFLIK